MSKTTRKAYTPKFKMAAAIDEVRGGADDVFGKTQQDRERKRSEEAARKRYDEAPRKMGQPAVEHDFLCRSCNDNGYDPEEARRGR